MPEWFEQFDDVLWLWGRRHSDPDKEAELIRKVLGLRRGQRVLDAPCGDGRISLALARRGIDVCGVDLNRRFVARARRRNAAAGLHAEFHRVDLRELKFENEFRAAINWFGSFGYFEERANRQVLARYARALGPGGRLLIEQPNREYVLRHFIAHHVDAPVTIRSRWEPSDQRVISDWRIERPDGAIERSTSMRLYTPAQMQRLLEGAGLRLETMLGDPEDPAWRRGSRRMIVVGQKG